MAHRRRSSTLSRRRSRGQRRVRWTNGRPRRHQRSMVKTQRLSGGRRVPGHSNGGVSAGNAALAAALAALAAVGATAVRVRQPMEFRVDFIWRLMGELFEATSSVPEEANGDWLNETLSTLQRILSRLQHIGSPYIDLKDFHYLATHYLYQPKLKNWKDTKSYIQVQWRECQQQLREFRSNIRSRIEGNVGLITAIVSCLEEIQVKIQKFFDGNEDSTDARGRQRRKSPRQTSHGVLARERQPEVAEVKGPTPGTLEHDQKHLSKEEFIEKYEDKEIAPTRVSQTAAWRTRDSRPAFVGPQSGPPPRRTPNGLGRRGLHYPPESK